VAAAGSPSKYGRRGEILLTAEGFDRSDLEGVSAVSEAAHVVRPLPEQGLNELGVVPNS
jgi:hypothetical protein